MTVKYHKFKFDKYDVHTWLIDGSEMIRLTKEYEEEEYSDYEWELEFPKIEMSFSNEGIIEYTRDIESVMKSIHTILGMKIK